MKKFQEFLKENVAPQGLREMAYRIADLAISTVEKTIKLDDSARLKLRDGIANQIIQAAISNW